MAGKAIGTTAGGKVGRGPRRRGLVLAGRGDGWQLWIPAGQWDRMTEKERAQLVEGQAALLEGLQAAAAGS